MDKLVDEFLYYLQYDRYKSVRTVESYGDDLGAFCLYVHGLDESLDWDSVDSDIIRGWMEEMMDRGNKATSVNRRLSSLRTFYRFAVSRKKLKHDPAYTIKGPQKEKPLPQYLREEEMDRLLGNEYWDDSFEDLRSRMLILVFYSTGIRLSELVGLDDSSIDYAQNQLKVLGKRNKERVIPFGVELRESLQNYQAVRNARFGVDGGALFLNNKAERMTQVQVREDVKRSISKVSTMKKRSPHVLRHTFATAMLNNNSGIESVQKLLGHESVSTTEIYTHTTFEQLKKVYAQAHPRGIADNGQSLEKLENSAKPESGND